MMIFVQLLSDATPLLGDKVHVFSRTPEGVRESFEFVSLWDGGDHAITAIR
jgi:hypothetical protein